MLHIHTYVARVQKEDYLDGEERQTGGGGMEEGSRFGKYKQDTRSACMKML